MSDVLLKTTGAIIGHFNAFKGSRPAFHGEHVVIVRGVSRDPIEIDELEAKLAELEDVLNAKEVDVLSDEGKEFVEKVDSYIRDVEDGGVAPDNEGLLKAIWKDKSGFGPLYVEVTATERDEIAE